MTDSALDRVNSMRTSRGQPDLRLRITVEGGGCSGFQYIFSWDETISDRDRIFREAVVTDDISLPLLAGATVDYVVTMMGEDFKIENPNAKSGCGCGTSFSL